MRDSQLSLHQRPHDSCLNKWDLSLEIRKQTNDFKDWNATEIETNTTTTISTSQVDPIEQSIDE